MFLLYVNDLADDLKSTVRLFANDVLLHCFIESNIDSDSLQSDWNKLEEWQNCWQMEFNLSKCKVLCFTTKKNVTNRQYMFCWEMLEKVDNHPYLGVLFDTKMKWSSHISNITRTEANVVLNVIKRNLWDCPREVRKLRIKA